MSVSLYPTEVFIGELTVLAWVTVVLYFSDGSWVAIPVADTCY